MHKYFEVFGWIAKSWRFCIFGFYRPGCSLANIAALQALWNVEVVEKHRTFKNWTQYCFMICFLTQYCKVWFWASYRKVYKAGRTLRGGMGRPGWLSHGSGIRRCLDQGWQMSQYHQGLRWAGFMVWCGCHTGHNRTFSHQESAASSFKFLRG